MASQQPEEQQRTCEKHGPYAAHLLFPRGDHWSRCDACLREDAAAEEGRRRAAETARETELMQNRLRHSGLEGRMLDASFDTFTTKKAGQAEALAACRQFVEDLNPDGGSNLWLIGPPGTGKSHLGAAMVAHVIRVQKRFACIASGRQIIRALRATWGEKASGGNAWGGLAVPSTTEEVIEHFGCAPLLVLDEVGVGFGSEAEQVQLLDVIDRRYVLRRPTVLMSNLVAKDLKAVLGDRAYDRLREGAHAVTCRWTSMRG